MGICDILQMQLKCITIIQREREKKLRREGGGEVMEERRGEGDEGGERRRRSFGILSVIVPDSR